MDAWKYYALGHEHHVVCNPLSEAKLDEIIELLALPPGARVLDIGCGKGEFLVRTAVRWGCQAAGVDLSPHFVAHARARVQSAGLEHSVRIVEGNGSEHRADPSSFDASACFGASWIWGGFKQTLDALRTWTKPGGLLLSGEPFWRRPPSPEYLKASELSESMFSSHAGNVAIGTDLGLRLMHTIVSSHDDWDRRCTTGSLVPVQTPHHGVRRACFAVGGNRHLASGLPQPLHVGVTTTRSRPIPSSVLRCRYMVAQSRQ